MARTSELHTPVGMTVADHKSGERSINWNCKTGCV